MSARPLPSPAAAVRPRPSTLGGAAPLRSDPAGRTGAAPVRVLLVDDHPLFRTGIRLFLGTTASWQVVGEANTAEEALALAATSAPEVVLMDIHLPDENGIVAARRLLGASPRAKVIIVSSDSSPALVHEAIVAGALGYILKQNAAEELQHAIQAVLNGKVYLCAEVSAAVMDNYRQCFTSAEPTTPTRLSQREIDLLRLIADGKRNKEIAETLGITPKSAETARLRLMKKLDVDSTAALTRYAIRSGYITA